MPSLDTLDVEAVSVPLGDLHASGSRCSTPHSFAACMDLALPQDIDTTAETATESTADVSQQPWHAAHAEALQLSGVAVPPSSVEHTKVLDMQPSGYRALMTTAEFTSCLSVGTSRRSPYGSPSVQDRESMESTTDLIQKVYSSSFNPISVPATPGMLSIPQSAALEVQPTEKLTQGTSDLWQRDEPVISTSNSLFGTSPGDSGAGMHATIRPSAEVVDGLPSTSVQSVVAMDSLTRPGMEVGHHMLSNHVDPWATPAPLLQSSRPSLPAATLLETASPRHASSTSSPISSQPLSAQDGFLKALRAVQALRERSGSSRQACADPAPLQSSPCPLPRQHAPFAAEEDASAMLWTARSPLAKLSSGAAALPGPTSPVELPVTPPGRQGGVSAATGDYATSSSMLQQLKAGTVSSVQLEAGNSPATMTTRGLLGPSSLIGTSSPPRLSHRDSVQMSASAVYRAMSSPVSGPRASLVGGDFGR